MLILDLWGISFHAVIVFGLGKNLLFKSVLGHCVKPLEPITIPKYRNNLNNFQIMVVTKPPKTRPAKRSFP